MRLVHGDKLVKQAKYIAQVIGPKQRVLDLACGTCDLVKFLHKSCRYEGWDLNDSFIRYYKKKGVNVKKKNILAFEEYPEVDVIVLIAVLHHVNPDNIKLLKECIKRAKKKVIVSEGYKGSETNRYYSLVKIRRRLGLDRFLGDQDGINENMHDDHIMSERDLRRFFRRFSECSLIKIGMNIVAIYDKNK